MAGAVSASSSAYVEWPLVSRTINHCPSEWKTLANTIVMALMIMRARMSNGGITCHILSPSLEEGEFGSFMHC